MQLLRLQGRCIVGAHQLAHFCTSSPPSRGFQRPPQYGIRQPPAQQRRGPSSLSPGKRRPPPLQHHVLVGGPLQPQDVGVVVLALARVGDLEVVRLHPCGRRERGRPGIGDQFGGEV